MTTSRTPAPGALYQDVDYPTVAYVLHDDCAAAANDRLGAPATPTHRDRLNAYGPAAGDEPCSYGACLHPGEIVKGVNFR